MSNSLKNYTNETKQGRVASPQTVRTPGRTDEVRNNAGGYVFSVDDKSRLERFLILGTDGGTYYVGEKKLTKDNVKFLLELIAKDERFVVDTIVDVSSNGRAYRNSPAIFALALVFAEGKDKAYARAALPKVARYSTALFEFAEYIEGLTGWGRAKRGAIADWYTSQDASNLAYQAVKYRQRNGWTHRDLFRLSHPVGVNPALGSFILGKNEIRDNTPVANLEILNGFNFAQRATSEKDLLETLGMFTNLPWEALPTQYLKSPAVWKKLFYNGQLNGQALLRNVTRMSRINAFDDMVFAADYAARLVDETMIAKTRLHPVQYLNAAVVYHDGQFDRDAGRGSYGWYSLARRKDWTVNGKVYDALNDGFHLAFKHVEPAGKRTMFATDVSGSMGGAALGIDLSCAQVAAAVAMTLSRTEPYSTIVGFERTVVDLPITAKTSLAQALKIVSDRNFGGTDAGAAIRYATTKSIDVDTFVILTDNETWAGPAKVTQLLKSYRDKVGHEVRLAAFGVAATDFSIVDPKDSKQMNFVGFDSNAPKVLADFSAGRL